ncbi:MAG: hypothetical protein FWG14_04405 [Peptococcaceae bacterium]|nr:hypothetical protein [Peptococcaceae bacterium]
MHTSVDLQDPFSYSLYPLIGVALLLLLLTLYFLLRALKKRRKQHAIPDTIPPTPLQTLAALQDKYLSQLDAIAAKLSQEKPSARKAYQDLSLTIRFFVDEVTHIKVQYCTLQDIEKLNMPILHELMQDYYAPEFSEHTLGNIHASLEKTREVIKKWH